MEHQQKIDLIAEAINRSKQNLKPLAFQFLLWGSLVPLGGLCQYFLISTVGFQPNQILWLWLNIVIVGFVFSSIYAYKKRKEQGYETTVDRFLKIFWTVYGLSYMLLLVISFVQHFNPTSIILFYSGIGTLITGLVTRFKPLVLGAVVLLVCSIFCLFVPKSILILVSSVGIFVGYFIPGFILKFQKNV
jgi:uncharacterized membrane-anchored protein